jgi:hypothetical protein
MKVSLTWLSDTEKNNAEPKLHFSVDWTVNYTGKDVRVFIS